MKLIKWALLAVAVLIIVIVVAVLFSLDGLIRSTVAKQATSSLNLTTTLGGAHLSIFGGNLSLTNLAVASPSGFSAPQMFDLGKAGVQVSYGQLREQPIRITAMTFDQPKLVIEQSGGKLNIQALTSQQSKTSTDGSGKETEPMKLIIDQLTITGADVTILPGIPGLDKPIDITVPAIYMSNVGSDDSAKNGAALKDIAVQVMSAIAAKCADSDKLPPEVRVLLKGNLGEVETEAKKALGNALNSVKNGQSPDLKASGDKLKGLFRK